jgi:hypothetical protein
MKIKVQDISEADNLKVNFLGKELELAHDDYLKRKNEITTKLYTIWRNQEIPAVYRDWIRQAARFIEESDMK